jgi:predicted acyl esterase
MRFFDRHVKGTETQDDPANVVQTSDGTWRAESTWPPSDSTPVNTTLNPGTYADDGQNEGTGSGTTGQGIWTISPRLTRDAHFAGTPRITVDVQQAPENANLVVDVYDIDSGRNATLISRGATLLSGNELKTIDLYGDDWKLPAGHRVGVLITGANAEWWAHVPTLQDVTIRDARITLPYLGCTRTANLEGDPSVKLEDYKASAPFNVPASTVEQAERSDFTVPPTEAC